MVRTNSNYGGQRHFLHNNSTAEGMGKSVISTMAQSIAGNQMAGATVCGYYGDASPELCARWYMTAAF